MPGRDAHSVIVTAGSVHMAVRDFIFRGGAHTNHRHIEAQTGASQRMIAIEKDFLSFYFFNCERTRATLPVPTLQLAAHFHPGRKLAPGYGLHQILIMLAERFLWLQFQSYLIAVGLPFKGFFEFGQDIAIAAVQIRYRLFTVIKQFAA